MRIQTKITVLGLALGFSALALADIPFFWLDKPAGRTNKHDPNSPLFVRTNTPVSGGPGNTPTYTFTPTASPSNTPFAGSPTFSPTLTVSPLPSDTPTPSPTITNTPNVSDYIKFEDFEVAPLVASYAYNDQGSGGTSTLALAHSTADFYAGTGSVRYDVTTAGSPQYGAGGGFGSNYSLPNGGLPVDATGAQKVSFYIKTSTDISFVVSIKEQNVAGTDPTNENWSASTRTLSASSAWQLVEIPVPSGFTENIYNPDCTTPGCAATGDNTMNLDKLVAFDIQFNPLAATSSSVVYVDDVYFVKQPLFTATPTNTNTFTPTYTFTPTPLPGFSSIWYDGETATGMLSDVTLVDMMGNTATDTVTSAELTTGGQSGANFLRSTLNIGAASYFGGLNIQRTAADVSTNNVIILSYRVPVSSTSDMNLGVQLIGSGTAPNDQSKVVTMTAYVTTGSVEVKGQWNTVTIPLSAFYGDNGQGGTFGAGDLTTLTGVQVRPMSRNFTGGALVGEFDVDTISFANQGSPPTERPEGIGWIIEDGMSPTGQSWTHAYWFSFLDSYTCASPVSAITFPATITDPPYATGGSGDTPGGAMHFQGTFGAANPEPAAANPCNPDGISWNGDEQGSYIGMGVSMVANPTPTPRNLTETAGVTSFTGLKVKLKLGSGHDPGNLRINLVRVATGSGNSGQDYYTLIPSSSLNTSTFTEFTLQFPAAGANSAQPPTAPVAWGQPSWATQVPFALSDVISFTFAPDVDTERGKNFNFYVDDIVLY